MTPTDEFKITIFRSIDDARTVWQLFERSSSHYAFQSYHWLSTWYKCIGRGTNIKLYIVLVEDNSGEPLMLLPLGVQKRVGVLCLVWLGARNTDYQGPLLGANWAERSKYCDFGKLWKSILAVAPRFDVVHFQKQPELIGDQPNPFVGWLRSAPTGVALSTELGTSLESFKRSRLGSKARSMERRKERRLRELGQVDFCVAATDDEIELAVATLIIQKSRKYYETGVRNKFLMKGYKEFYRLMAKSHSRDPFVHLSYITLNGDVLAVQWGLAYNKRFYYLMPSYCDGELQKYSPGNLLLTHLFDWCIQREMEVFDFTVGDEDYKRKWCTRELLLYESIESRTIKGQAYMALMKLRRSCAGSMTLRAIKRRAFRLQILFQMARMRLGHLRPKKNSRGVST